MAIAKKTTSSKATSAGVKPAAPKTVAAPAPEVKTVKAAAPAPAAVKQATPVSAAATQVIKPVAAPVAPVKPVAPAKPAARTISQSEWRSMVEQAAFFVAEKNGFSGNPEEHWAAAEKQVLADLTGKGIKVV